MHGLNIVLPCNIPPFSFPGLACMRVSRVAPRHRALRKARAREKRDNPIHPGTRGLNCVMPASFPPFVFRGGRNQKKDWKGIGLPCCADFFVAWATSFARCLDHRGDTTPCTLHDMLFDMAPAALSTPCKQPRDENHSLFGKGKG